MTRPWWPAMLALVPLLVAGCGGSRKSASAIDLTEMPPAEETHDDRDLLHLRFVLDEDQAARYASLGPVGRAEMMRQVWAELDPTPTTPVNERHRDHYRRLAYIDEHFSMEKEPGFDRRGELLLRYGPPDERRIVMGDVVEGVGLLPPREVWIYYWLGAAYELEDPRFQGEFQDVFESGRVGERADDIDIARLSPDSEIPVGVGRHGLEPLDAEEQLAMQKLRTMLEMGQQGLERTPRAYLHDYGGAPLDYVFDIQTFSDLGSGLTLVDINLGLLAKDLSYREEDGGWVAVLDVEGAVRTLDWNEVGLGTHRTLDRRASLDELKGVLVLDQVPFVIEPGEYRLALSVRDEVSGNIGIYQTEFVAPPYLPGDFAISDVQLALDVQPASEGAPFVKGNYQVVPYPLGEFPRGRDIHVYFEIYGLGVSPEGDSLYEVDFLIRPRTKDRSSWFGSSKGRMSPGVATTYEGISKSPNVQESVALDPGTFDEDVYDLEITVRDRVIEREVTRTATFSVRP